MGPRSRALLKSAPPPKTALQDAQLAMRGVSLPGGVGILGGSIEETFANLGRLNNPAHARHRPAHSRIDPGEKLKNKGWVNEEWGTGYFVKSKRVTGELVTLSDSVLWNKV